MKNNNKGKEGKGNISYVGESNYINSSLDSKNMLSSSDKDDDDIPMYKGLLNKSMNDTLIDDSGKEISNIQKAGNSNGNGNGNGNGNSTLKFLNNLDELKIEGKIIFI